MNNSNKIPSGWKSTTLGAFMEFKNGINADKSAYGQGTEFVNVMDIFKSHFLKREDIQGKVQITEKQKAESSVMYGDLLFNRTSEVPNEIAYSSVYLDHEEITFGGFVIRGRQQEDVLDPYFAGYCFNSSNIRREMIRRSQGVVRANIGQKDLNKVPILIPPKPEQKQIASTLALWDKAIEKTEALIAAKEKQFEWLCQTYFKPGNSKNSGWEKHKIASFVTVRNEREVPSEQVPLYSLTIENGVTAKTDRYNREFLVIDKGGKKYKVVHPKDIVFNPANLRWGAIARSEVEHKVVLSPIYEVLRVDENKIDSDFLTYALTCSRQIAIFATMVEGTLVERMAVKIDTFLSCHICVPSSKEKQKEIAHVLNLSNQEISLLKKTLEQYRSQKRGLMQKLLTGEWQVSSTQSGAEGEPQEFSKESVA
ncbi:MAG: restriction endonuclease subunit S [Cellvibrionaceae bacterium]